MLIQRDAGLVRALGPLGLAASIVSMMIGAGIFVAPSALAASVGSYTPLAFLACALGIGAVGICCAEGGSRMPTSGGMYGYIEAALGPLTGYLAGTLLWFGDLLACAGVAAALADVAASVAPSTHTMAVRATVIVGVVGGIALVNIGGRGTWNKARHGGGGAEPLPAGHSCRGRRGRGPRCKLLASAGVATGSDGASPHSCSFCAHRDGNVSVQQW